MPWTPISFQRFLHYPRLAIVFFYFLCTLLNPARIRNKLFLNCTWAIRFSKSKDRITNGQQYFIGTKQKGVHPLIAWAGGFYERSWKCIDVIYAALINSWTGSPPRARLIRCGELSLPHAGGLNAACWPLIVCRILAKGTNKDTIDQLSYILPHAGGFNAKCWLLIVCWCFAKWNDNNTTDQLT